MRVPDQIQIRDAVIHADRPRLGRQVRTHEHGDPSSAGVSRIGLASMHQVSLELIDGGTNKTRSTAPLDLDEECIGYVAVLELDASTDEIAGCERVL